MLEKLVAAHQAGKLTLFGAHAPLVEEKAFAAFLKPLRRTRWFVYSKPPFAGPKAVLAYLSRYTHRVAIANRRLIAADANSVTFKAKDYRIEGPGRYTTMTLATGEFIRRFLLHVLPKGFHRIRHYGLLAGTAKADMVAKVRQLLCLPATEPDEDVATDHVQHCPCCGGRMVVIETFAPGANRSIGRRPRRPPSASIRHERHRSVRRHRASCWLVRDRLRRCSPNQAPHTTFGAPLMAGAYRYRYCTHFKCARRKPPSKAPTPASLHRPPSRPGHIPIVPAAPSLLTSRGFIPRGLSDTGPGVCRNRRDGPASETLHKNRHLQSGIELDSNYGQGAPTSGSGFMRRERASGTKRSRCPTWS